MELEVIGHPGLALRVQMVALPRPLGELTSPPWLTALLAPDASAPVAPPAEIRTRVRDLLRGHGYRPTGRGKPSSEYLAAAAAAGRLGPINPVVDLGNAVSLHSGLPISVVDLGVAMPPLRVDIAPAGTSYVFNASGQVIDIGGLLCLSDVQGPCANAVKDAQRTKTTAATQAVLAVVWGTTEPSGHADATHAWMCESFDRLIGA